MWTHEPNWAWEWKSKATTDEDGWAAVSFGANLLHPSPSLLLYLPHHNQAEIFILLLGRLDCRQDKNEPILTSWSLRLPCWLAGWYTLSETGIFMLANLRLGSTDFAVFALSLHLKRSSNDLLGELVRRLARLTNACSVSLKWMRSFPMIFLWPPHLPLHVVSLREMISRGDTIFH